MAVLPAPADLVYVQEYQYIGRTAQERPRWNLASKSDGRFTEFNHAFYNTLHSAGGNLLFCDGHAKWQKKDSISYTQFGANPNGGTNCNTKFRADGSGGATCTALF